MDLVDARTAGLKLSIKLYHANELQLVHQQSMTEAPVKVLNSVPGLEVGQPNLQILADPIINAQFDPTTNTVKGWLASVELFADSPSEVAWAIAHELGHAHQHLTGTTTFDTNVEFDADQFSLFGLLLTGYDAYAAGGGMGKLMMASERTGIVSQIFDNLNEDPHKSFTTRMGLEFA